MGKVLLIISVVVVALIANFFYTTFRDGTLPTIPKGYWGPGDGSKVTKEDTKIHPFKINVDQKILDNLKSKLGSELSSSRFTPPLEGVGFQYGFNTVYLQKVLNYWHKDYDWRGREKLLNQYPSFKTMIFGLDIHFQHIKGGDKKYKDTKPLLILHGWPGSFVEHQKIIPLLTNPQDSDFNFELVIPSLPGYGFSDAPVRPGLGTVEMARIFVELMKRLGHEQFYVQGGDWGALITSHLGTIYPGNVKGIHMNMCTSLHPRNFLRTFVSSIFPSWFMTEQEMTRFLPFSKGFTFLIRETGYLHLQATKPDTVGVALSQSPSGLAAYMLEKFSTWTKEDGMYADDGLIPSLEFSMDELLDNVMVYWVNNAMTSAMRLYSEALGPKEMGLGLDSVPVQVPTGCIQTMDPYGSQGEFILRDKYPNIVHYNLVDRGGHFFSMEYPKLLADDVIKFVGKVK